MTVKPTESAHAKTIMKKRKNFDDAFVSLKYKFRLLWSNTITLYIETLKLKKSKKHICAKTFQAARGLFARLPEKLM